MSKTTLLAATALSAIALAGAAAAGPITAGTINGVTIDTLPATGTGIYTDTTATTSYYLASEAVQPSGQTNFTGTMSATVGVTGTSVASNGLLRLGVGQYDIVYTLSGGGSPTFSTGVQGASLASDAAGTCTTSYSIINNGGAGQGTVTARVTVGGACTTTAGANQGPSSFTLTNGISIASAGTVVVSATVGNIPGALAGATGIGGTTTSPAAGTSTAQAATLVKTASIFDAAITADTNPTTLALGTAPAQPYSALVTGGANDAIIGTVKINQAANPTDIAGTGIFTGLTSQALPAIVYEARINSLNGDFSKLNATIGGTTTTDVAGNASATRRTGIAAGASGAAALPVVLVLDNGSPATTVANVAQSYQLAVTAAFDAAVTAANQRVTLPTLSATNLQSLAVQGTTFVAPWMGFSDTFNNVLRVSNSSTSATGPVTLAITSPVSGNAASPVAATVTRTVCTSADLSKLANVPASGELNITSADLRTCFGTAPARGDVRVTIQAASDSLSAKLRIVNPGSVVTEQSLGAVSSGVATTN